MLASYRLSLLLAVFLTSNINAADLIDSLRHRQAVLEQELDKIKSQISALDAIRSNDSQKANGQSWFIKEYGIDEINSAGGVEPYFVIINPNTSTDIKYIDISVSLYNAVGDMIPSDIDGEFTKGLDFTGPLSNATGEKRIHWGPIWYNSTGACLKIQNIEITFMDGKVLKFNGKAVKNALAPGLSNDCQFKK